MHAASYNLANLAFSRSTIPNASMIDIGSYDINGTLRPLAVQRGWYYTGLDVREGPNVDVVSLWDEHYPFPDNTFDVVACANALHNVARPWIVVPEMARILKSGGLLVIVTVWRWGLNSHPFDYFRFTDEGLRILFDETKCLTDYVLTRDDDGNTSGSAIKR